MGKPKKDQKYKSMKAYIGVKDADRYMAQKLQHLIRQYEKMADMEPWNVDPKKYIMLLQKYAELSKVIERKRKAKDVKKGVDSQGVGQNTQQEGSAELRQDEPFSMDA